MAFDIVDAIERAKKIKLVVLDVHGVLTSGAILYNEDGMKFQVFHHDDDAVAPHGDLEVLTAHRPVRRDRVV